MKPFLALLLICMLLSCNNEDPAKIDEVEYEATKETLEQKEKKSPLRFLKAEGDYHRNIVGQTVIKGTVTNTATVATYKNIRLKLLYFDKDGKQFENHEEVLDEVVQPGEVAKFKAKYKTQKKTDSVAVKVMSATVAE